MNEYTTSALPRPSSPPLLSLPLPEGRMDRASNAPRVVRGCSQGARMREVQTTQLQYLRCQWLLLLLLLLVVDYLA